MTLHFVCAEDAGENRGDRGWEVFDPAFFIDFKFADKNPVKMGGRPPPVR